MKNSRSTLHHSRWAFTLVELLVVISIIGVLAGLLLPALAKAKIKAQIITCRLDMKNLAAAINKYEDDYSRFPGMATNIDLTYGPVPGAFDPGNSNIIIILMDIDTGINAGHRKNPQQHVYSEPKTTSASTGPGVSVANNYQFYDPWGTPYVITLDLNYDNKCLDAFYGLRNVSQPASGVAAGYNGLVNTRDAGGNGNNFELNAPVMIWSFGPDGKIDPNPGNVAAGKANAGLNKDNVLGWQ